jgi:ubiquitin C-terminal hydrolase
LLSKFESTEGYSFIRWLYKKLFCFEEKIEGNYPIVSLYYSYSYIRERAYCILISLIKSKKIYRDEIITKITEHHPSIAYLILEDDIDTDIRGNTVKCTGLRNYGATCYINSLIQQLEKLPEFLAALYSIDCESSPSSGLYHLQYLFASLRLSSKAFHSPLHFIESIKGLNNEPINIRIQQDSEEFLNILIERLEEQMSKEQVVMI